MLNEYLAVLTQQEKKAQADRDLRAVLDKLPLEDLYKLANGEKLGHESTDPATGWLEQFKGTAMLPAAVELERREIELDAAHAQAYAMEEEHFRQKDQVNLEKRLLEVQLAEGGALEVDPAHAEQVAGEASAGMDAQQDQAAMAEEAAMAGGAPPGAEGEEPPPEMGAEGVEAAPTEGAEKKPALKKEEKKKEANAIASPASSPQMAAEGLGAAKTPPLANPGALTNTPGMKMAEAVGRRMARADAEKIALDVAGLASRAKDFARLNPGAAIGAGVGAAGGLAHGLQKDEHGQRHLIGGLAQGAVGGAVGAAGGHAAQHMGSNFALARSTGLGMKDSLLGAARATGTTMAADAGRLRTAVMGQKTAALEERFRKAVEKMK